MMQFSRDQLKQGLKDHMEQVEKSTPVAAGLLINPEYRTAACLLSIMEKQDEGSKTAKK